jgi:hypothetical protein
VQVLDKVAERLHARGRHGVWDRLAAARFIVRQYRVGALGQFTLDPITPP